MFCPWDRIAPSLHESLQRSPRQSIPSDHSNLRRRKVCAPSPHSTNTFPRWRLRREKPPPSCAKDSINLQTKKVIGFTKRPCAYLYGAENAQRLPPTLCNSLYSCAGAIPDRFASEEKPFASDCSARELEAIMACTPAADVPELLARAPDTSRSASAASTAASDAALDRPWDKRRRPCLSIVTVSIQASH